MRIDYEKMLTDYNTNMVTNLRGFSGGPPPFELWVPAGDDHAKSIEDIIDIAKSAGNEVVVVDHGDIEYNYYSHRAGEAETILNKISDEFGHTTKMKIHSLKKNILTIDYEEAPSDKNFHFALLKIEAELNTRLNEKFDIQTMTLEDKNKRACAKP